MKRKLKVGFWEYIARLILTNRIKILAAITVLTVFLVFQWKNLNMTYTEANLLPKKHIENQKYDDFLSKFGEEGNLIVIGFQDPKFFTPKAFSEWNKLISGLKSSKNVELVVSINDLKKLQKDTLAQKFELGPLINPLQTINLAYLQNIKTELFTNLPFYEGLLFNKKSGS